MTYKIGFIGGGNMASSLIGGLVAEPQTAAENIWVFEPSTEKANALVEQFGINAARNNVELIENVDIVVIAVKPQVLQQVLEPLAISVAAKKPLLVSVVAGISARSIEKWLGVDLAIIRVMPNTPALIGMGACGLYANQRVNNDQKNAAESLFDAVGISAWVESEQDIDSVTALSGSGPAYFMLFLQGLIESAEAAGLKPETAKALAVQTAAGAAQLVSSSDLELQTLIDNVTSPRGTTEKALESFNTNGLKALVNEAFEAARTRSHELAKELG